MTLSKYSDHAGTEPVAEVRNLMSAFPQAGWWSETEHWVWCQVSAVQVERLEWQL